MLTSCPEGCESTVVACWLLTGRSPPISPAARRLSNAPPSSACGAGCRRCAIRYSKRRSVCGAGLRRPQSRAFLAPADWYARTAAAISLNAHAEFNQVVTPDDSREIAYPANSLPAIEECYRAAVARVEIDASMLRDADFLVVHDLTLDDSTTGHTAQSATCC